ncbi:hypothetical protein [Nonomuraea solani]|uniref:hypothetical protein n=1 Tax=Nonomuraea solani TaxID=1144553 RepID=UPI001356A38E|nr:hypothetical protein [Nonomuraea solani]
MRALPGRTALQPLPAVFGGLVGLIAGILPETIREGGSGQRLAVPLVAQEPATSA